SLGAVLLCTDAPRHSGRQPLPTRRAAQLCERVADGAEQGRASEAYLYARRQRIAGALTTHGPALPHRQLLMAAPGALRTTIRIGSQASRAGAMTAWGRGRRRAAPGHRAQRRPRFF